MVHRATLLSRSPASEGGAAGARQGGAAVRTWIRALDAVGSMGRDAALTLSGLVEAGARAHGGRTALAGAGESLSYAALAEQIELIARWATASRPGATLGLLMPSCPAYVATWLGLSRAGCVVALLNPSLGGDLMRHAVEAAGCDLVIAAEGMAIEALGAPVLRHDDFARQLRQRAGAPLPPAPGRETTALLVFTSGTTGLPKAARVSHGRVLEWALWFGAMMDLRADDRIYDCLPLSHSTGGIVAIGAALARGASVQIAPGFRAGRFWDEVADGGCTIFFYIGELCRYLAQSPAHPRERAHRLRLACGNGLHGSVWEPFQARFGVSQILEFYAATEGNVSLYNVEGRPGAIGRVPPFLQQRFPLALVRIEAETGAPVRDGAGRCVRCGPDEAGEAIGRVEQDGAAPARRFDGYTDEDASERKLLRDVFTPGDCWFRSGDLMRRDAAGFYYFVDRMGDTFRWKGENVSTTEVAAVVRGAPGVADAVVYGVSVPGQEGRAGMAAVVAAEGFAPEALRSHLAARLPAYAQPLFVRLCPALDRTGTFKLFAARLAGEGYAGLADPVWFNDRAAGAVVAVDADLARAIADGTRRT